MYMVLEGVDTCGKSTQIELLKERYPYAIFTKEPGGSVLGERVRDMVLFTPQKEGFVLDQRAEALLFLADRAQHYAEVLHSHSDKLIISDRSVISGIAYARGIDMGQNIELNRFALQGMLPDLVIMLCLREETLQDRIQRKTQDSVEQRGVSYMLEVQARMKEAIQALDLNKKAVFIDAQMSQEAICSQICLEIESILKTIP